MELFWKTSAGTLIALVLILSVGRQEKDIALVLAMTASAMAAVVAFSFLEPVLAFLFRLEQTGIHPPGILKTLLKTAGIGILTETVGMICQDSGQSSLARGMQLLGTAAILYLSLPVFEYFLELMESVLEGL